MTKRRSPPLTPQMAATIKRLLMCGEYPQHEIAARLKINQGRVSEVKTGKRFANIPADSQINFDFM